MYNQRSLRGITNKIKPKIPSFRHHYHFCITRRTLTSSSNEAGIKSHTQQEVVKSIQISRNVRYSNSHSNNILDIYEPLNTSQNIYNENVSHTNNKTRDVVLYLHGGLWMRGSKDESHIKSTYDLLSAFVKYSFRNSTHESDNNENDIKTIKTKIQSNMDRTDEIDYNTSMNKNEKPTYSNNNVGMTLATQGITTYIANYRLIHKDNDTNDYNDDNNMHPHQTLDASRAIIYVLSRELQKKNQQFHNTRVFVAGYSAGAHLSALALSHPDYLLDAFNEFRNEEKNQAVSMADLLGLLRGYIGISGAYNLKRLYQSPISDITIGPAFYGNRNMRNNDEMNINDENELQMLLKDASPLHVLLQQWRNIKKYQGKDMDQELQNVSKMKTPLLAQIPVLLLNAESDFHLESDSKEILVALSQFDNDNLSIEQNGCIDYVTSKKQSMLRQHFLIPARNHLSIIWQFGSGYLKNDMNTYDITENQYDSTVNSSHNDDQHDILPPEKRKAKDNITRYAEDDNGIFGYIYRNQELSILNQATLFLSSTFYDSIKDKRDDAATRIFDFVSKLK